MPVIASYTIIRPDTDLDRLYHKLDMDYPKFFKMDELCKISILGAETVLRQVGCADDSPKLNMSEVIFNRSSSIDTDVRYIETISQDPYFPSPALFSYTLANILTGHICIKYRIYGESSLYISDKPYASDFRQKVLWSLQDGCLCGWVDCCRGKHELIMMLVRKDGEGIPFTIEKINEIFNQL